MNQTQLSVLIVGCGNIAGLFDKDRSSNDFPYTHAGAYKADKRFLVMGCIDPDFQRRKDFMKVWGISNGYDSINELAIKNIHFDVISICSPTHSHLADIDVALQLKPKLIFCEKPITSLVNNAEKLVEESKKLNILFAVNYSRRWDPDIVDLRENIKNRSLGHLRAINGIYNKGLLNNGSHMIDILLYLLGDLTIIQAGKPKNDFFLNDPTVDVWLEGPAGTPIYIASGDAGDYSIFELQFIFSSGVLTMENGGLSWRKRSIIDSKDFEGYRVLDQGKFSIGNYPQSMASAIDNIYRAIVKNEPMASTGDSALRTQRICENILLKIH
jgi:predicted dehydrogenase